MASRDLVHDITVKQTITNAVIKTNQTAASGNSVDSQGYESLIFIWEVGLWVDGTHTPTLQESDDNSTFTAVAAGDIIGGANLTAITDNTQVGKSFAIGYRGAKRYVSLQVNSSGTTGLLYGVTAILGDPIHRPTF